MKNYPLLTKMFLFVFIFMSMTISLNLFNTYVRNEIVFKVDDTINKLVVGSSTLECAINDKILKNSINKSASADAIFYSYLKIKKIVELNSNIDTVFLGFSPRVLSKRSDDNWLFDESHFTSRIGNFYSLMDSQDLKMFRDHFGYNFHLKTIANIGVRSFRNLKEYLVGDIKEIYGSYKSSYRIDLSKALNKLRNQEAHTEFTISEIEIGYLDKIIELCKKNKIELIFISAPIRKEYISKNPDEYIEFNALYQRKYSNFTFMDFSSFSLPDSGYSDVFHLSHSGSDMFTEHLQEQLAK